MTAKNPCKIWSNVHSAFIAALKQNRKDMCGLALFKADYSPLVIINTKMGPRAALSLEKLFIQPGETFPSKKTLKSLRFPDRSHTSKYALEKVIVSKKYKHSKTGTIYTVTDVVVLEPEGVPLVIYTAYLTTSVFWARTLEDFTGEVVIQGENIPRFDICNE